MNGRMWGIFWGIVLVISGTLLLLANLGLLPFSLEQLWSYTWPLLLVLLGLLVLFGRNLNFGNDESSDRVIRLTGQELRDLNLSYSFGDRDIHLTDAVIPDGTAHVHISQGVGDLNVWLPRATPAWIRASAGMGDIKVLDQSRDGFGPRVEYMSPDYATASRRVELRVETGIGDVNVQVGA